MHGAEFALVQPHGSVTKGTPDGGETFFRARRHGYLIRLKAPKCQLPATIAREGMH
jgi:hypothetical protein